MIRDDVKQSFTDSQCHQVHKTEMMSSDYFMICNNKVMVMIRKYKSITPEAIILFFPDQQCCYAGISVFSAKVKVALSHSRSRPSL